MESVAVVRESTLGYKITMTEDQFRDRLRSVPDAKKIAIAIYGESVAAYRYGVLVEKADSEHHRRTFEQMKHEELGHQRALEALAKKHFPNADFVLTPDDKDLVIVGARMLEVTDADSFRKAMRFLHDTELRTGRFYRVLHELMPSGDLGRFLTEMADECLEHAQSLLAIDSPFR